jgi:hypothetical protein
MKYLTIIMLFVTFSACSLQTVESQTKIDEKPAVAVKMKQPVLVELFTSEG